MHSLFVDSTSGLDIGLLDENYFWLQHSTLDEKKPSEIIHFEIFNLLKKYNLNIKNIQIIISSGPGSYTGMRLSEGLAQVFELSGIPIYSFYHFDIPKLTGVKNGYWVTNAFKNQFFVFKWNDMENEKALINKDLLSIPNDDMVFAVDTNELAFTKFSSTKDLIKNKSSIIFPQIVLNKSRTEPFYFRSLDEEFQKSC